MVGLPKSIIKKYGISKKAWAVYRGKPSKKAKTMAKKGSKKRSGIKKVFSRRSGMFNEVKSASVVGIEKLAADTIGSWKPMLPARATGDGLLWLFGAAFGNRDARVVGIANGVAHVGQAAVGGGLGISIGGDSY